MATLALYAAGAAIGSAAAGGATGAIAFGLTAAQIGGMIGGTVGGVIDSQMTFPMLFARSRQAQGAKLDDVMVMTANEGSPIPEAYGRNVRVAGPVVYCPELTEEDFIEGQRAGGKHGMGVAYGKFRGDVCVKICRGPISRVKKVWADSRLIYDQADAPEGIIEVVTDEVDTDVSPVWLPNSYHMRIDSPPGGPDLSVFPAGRTVQVSGYAPSANNGSFQVVSSGGDGPSGSFVVLYISRNGSPSDRVAGADTVTIRLVTASDAAFVDIRFKTGTLVQTADPAYEAREGAGNAPTFRGWATGYIEGLDLTASGDRIPQLNWLVEEDPDRTVGGAIALILERRGFSTDDFDVSLIDDIPLEGYVVSGPTSAARAIEPLLLAFDIGARVSGGRLQFFKRSEATEVRIAAADLAAREPGSDFRRPILFSQDPPWQLPTQVVVRFIEPELNYQPSAQRERRRFGYLENVQQVDVAVTMTAAQARAVARRILWEAWTKQKSARLAAPANYLHVEVGDVVSAEAGGQTWRIEVAEITRGLNLLHEISGLVVGADSAPAGALAHGPLAGGVSDLYEPPPLLTIVADLPALSDVHNSSAGYYFGASPAAASAFWRGAQLFESFDDSAFSVVAPILLRTPAGPVVSSPLGVGLPWSWDVANTVDVELPAYGSLSSKTADQVLAGENWALIGSEIVGFRTATLVAPKTYRLSNLLRGLRGTEHEIGGHAAGEGFVLLSAGTVSFRTENFSSLATPRYMKAVATGGSPQDGASQQPELTGATLRPFSPVNLTGSRDVSNNLTVTWTRRSRAFHRCFSPLQPPMIESSLSYDVEVLDAPGGSVLRTWYSVGDEEQEYTAAEQVTDGLTPGDPVTVRVFQNNNPYGRGTPAEATV